MDECNVKRIVLIDTVVSILITMNYMYLYIVGAIVRQPTACSFVYDETSFFFPSSLKASHYAGRC